ncbi:MAG: glycosyltransferase family 4 protein, partial [Saprospiraceae bacterium]
RYDYRVFCWKSDPAAWRLWASDLEQQHRSKVIVSGTTLLSRPPFVGECFRFLGFLMLYPALSLRHLRHHIPQIGFWRACHRLLEDYKILQARPDILHFEFGTLAVGKIYLKDFLRCKAVVSFRGYDLNFFQLGNERAYQQVWEQADGFHFLGSDLLARARRRGFPEGKILRLISPAIDLESFRPSHPTPPAALGTPIRIVSVSRLVWKKGLGFGLLAFSGFLKKGGRGTYHIVGEGPAREELLFYAHELGIAGQVVFHGKCSPEQVRAILDEADIFLHPAISEGFCNAAMEAQAMQLPVVCFASDGLQENVAHGETGYVAPLWDWPQLAQHLHDLWQNPAKRQLMGEKGRNRVAQFFSVEKQIAAFDEFYQCVLREGRV